jgi:hypothetical protein
MNEHQQNKGKLKIDKDSLIRGLKVAILVGTLLNIINNPGLISFSFSGLNIYRVFLTFLVPFCVSLYSSVLANREKCAETTIPG